MWGFVLAAVVGGIVYALNTAAPENAFLSGTTVLFWWYLIWSAIGVVIVGLIALGITAGGALAGGSKFGLGGGMIGAAAGGGLGLVMVALVVVFSGMRVAGAYFLHDAVVMTDNVYVWETAKLVIGGILVGLPFFIGGKFKASSSTTTAINQGAVTSPGINFSDLGLK